MLAEQTTARPARLKHETQIGFTYRFKGAELNKGIGTTGLNIEFDRIKKGFALNGETCEIALVSNLHTDLFRTHIAELQQRNLSIERLVQGRIENDLTEPKGLSVSSSKQHYRGEHHHELSNHIPFLLNGLNRCHALAREGLDVVSQESGALTPQTLAKYYSITCASIHYK